MDRTVKSPSMSTGEYHELAGIAALAVGVPSLVELAGIATWAAPMYGAPEQSVPLTNPVSLGWQLLATHELAWTGEATAALGTIVGGGLAAVAATAVGVRWACRRCAAARSDRRYRKGRPAHMALGKAAADRHAIDAQARWMARGAELDDLCWSAMEAKAAELGVVLGEGQVPGVLIGRAVTDGRELWGSYEDLHLDIWGPRSGKTTSRVIPAIMDAPGAVVATSNKRDVVDATRAHRSEFGDIWVFDPQDVAEAEPSWYWDPCAWVLGPDGGQGAQERASELAGHFADSVDSTGGDPFFEPEGEDLLKGLILAAALAKEPITKVFEWVTKPTDETPVVILDNNGFGLVAGALSSRYNSADKEKSGVFSTAKKMAAVLQYEGVRRWVCPPARGERSRRAFDVDEFVTSTDTLYLLSKDKKSSAGPLVTAFASAVAAAGEADGTRAGGRMPVPMVIVLDEAANIVRWRDLPKQYSHFGSRGIVVLTILQSWAQGVRCWGEDGMRALLSATNVLTLGAGLKDTGFLRDVSELVGQHHELVTSTSRGRRADSATVSTSRASEATLASSDISAMPKGRALVLVSGHRPTLVRTTPWMERGDADTIRASIADHTPHRTSTAPRLRAVPSAGEEAA